MPKQGNNWTSVRLDRTLLVEAAHDISGRRPRTPPLALPVLVDDWIPIEDLARVVNRGAEALDLSEVEAQVHDHGCGAPASWCRISRCLAEI